MLGLCSICGDPVEENKQYCPTCQAELDAAYAIRQREIEADAAELERYLRGENIERGTTRCNAETEPIRQHQHTWKGKSRRLWRGGQ